MAIELAINYKNNKDICCGSSLYYLSEILIAYSLKPQTEELETVSELPDF